METFTLSQMTFDFHKRSRGVYADCREGFGELLAFIFDFVGKEK
jgi:hypothetical protein